MKVANIDFHGNPSSGSRTDTRAQTEGHGEGNTRFSRLCERALKKVLFAPDWSRLWNYCVRFSLQPPGSAGVSIGGARLQYLWRAPRSYCAEQKQD
jgi:hypothetical protein